MSCTLRGHALSFVLLVLATHRAVGVTDHQDTVLVSQCFSLASQLPLNLRLLLGTGLRENRLCLNGWINLCTQDINLTVHTGSGAPILLAAGDGTASPTFTNTTFIPLGDEVFPGTACDNSSIRLRDSIVSRRGLRGCLDLRVSCFPGFDVNLPCFDLGDDTDGCTATEKCECIQHPECGWCAGTGTCTRMVGVLPTAANNNSRYSSTQPVCGCGSGLLTARNDPLGSCAPSQPPAMPPAQPPPPPSTPSPPGSPPAYPPFVTFSWLNGVAFEPTIDATRPLFLQLVLWVVCTAVVLLTAVVCVCGERRRAASCSSSGHFAGVIVATGFGGDAGA